MIIDRQYEYFFRLIERDPKAKDIYKKACYHCFNGDNDEDGKRIYEANLQNRLFELDMGCGICDPRILWDGFSKLDKEEPYDNGFMIKDVNRVTFINHSWRGDSDTEPEEPAWVEIALVYSFDGYDNIVKIIREEDK